MVQLKTLSFFNTEDLANIRKVLNGLSGKVYQKKDEPVVNEKKVWKFDWDVFLQQVLDSFIVGGITFFATLASGNTTYDFRAGIIAFGITFLTKLKEYRKIE